MPELQSAEDRETCNRKITSSGKRGNVRFTSIFLVVTPLICLLTSLLTHIRLLRHFLPQSIQPQREQHSEIADRQAFGRL